MRASCWSWLSRNDQCPTAARFSLLVARGWRVGGAPSTRGETVKMLRMLLDRLDDKSTWLALGGFLAAFGFTIEPGVWEGISLAGMGLATLVIALLPTKDAERAVADAVNRRLPERLRSDTEDNVRGVSEADPARRVRHAESIYGAFDVD